MRKIILFFIVFLFVINALQAKIEGTYVIEDVNETTSCYVTFFDEKYYYIEFYRIVSDDLIETTMFSFGCFSLNKNELSLMDVVNNYKIQLDLLSEKEIRVNKGFSFLKNKTFIYDSEIDTIDLKHYYDFYFEKTKTEYSLQKEINKYNLDDKCYILYDGIYSFANQRYKLKIDKEGSYVFSHEDIEISEGTWTRQSNILSLYDLSLQHSFYVFIEEDGLNCKFLPDIYRDDLFILDK